MKAKSKQTSKPLPRGRRPAINVTEAEIEIAMAKKSGHCMIALAIKRAFPEVTAISVDFATIRWSDKRKGLRYTYFTPAKVMAVLIAWDQGIKPKPFSFKLRGPHITTMRMQPKPGKKRERVHKFGKKKRIKVLGRTSRADRPTIVGGKPPPVLPSGRDRVFGS